ncbi:MAG: hypothetical protein ACXWZR_20370 [Mycobacterium sp.]
MRKLVITQNITVDGAVEMLGGWFDPQVADKLLVAESPTGRRGQCVARRPSNFEDFRSYWPRQTRIPRASPPI